MSPDALVFSTQRQIYVSNSVQYNLIQYAEDREYLSLIKFDAI